ncbi:protein SGT1 homolog [Syzygium oleosum]|uniref:protein SGT1 homolog n=1 Tax=Syzygium oleosum TaxID=219896 RepID=UPI0024BB20F1|nr:protein SGT1 homolog [Syzygium oleosum]
MERLLLLRSFGTASDLSLHAVRAYVERDYEIAVELFTRAISLSPEDAQLFSDRAEAHLMLGNFTEAVADASRAIELDPSMSKAYFRLGNAFYELKKYQTAKATLEVGSSLAPADAKITDLIKRCDEHIAETYGEILNPPLGKASTHVVPVEGGQESGHIVNEVPTQATSNQNTGEELRICYIDASPDRDARQSLLS